MKQKEKLLIVSAISPFPKTSGGAVRIYNTIKYLSNQFELYFVFFMQEGNLLKGEDELFLKKNTKFYTCFFQKTQKQAGSFVNKFQPFWFSDWLDDELKIFLPKIIKEYNINNVQIDCTQLLYLYEYIPKDINKIFVAYDISTISFWRRLCEIRNFFLFVIHFLRWLEIYFYEKHYLPKFNQIISMSSNDKLILKNKFGLNKVDVIPNGIEQINFLNKKITKVINLGYIGSFNHPPNRKAVIYFIEEIAPLLEKNRIKYKYFIAGDNNREEIETIIDCSELKNNKNIINLGKIKKVEEFYKKIDVLIAPIFSGSGSRIKILESLSFGIPVITTAIGAEGINIDSNYLKIADDRKGFLNIIKEFLKTNRIVDLNLKNKIQPFLWRNIFKNYRNSLFK